MSTEIVDENTPPPSVSRPTRRWWRGPRWVLAAVAALAVTIVLALWIPHLRHREPQPGAGVPVSWRRPVVSRDGLAERSGVVIRRVSVTGAGGLVDLRFTVVDPSRATAVHDPAKPPAIVDEQSGLVVHDLFMNHAHSGSYRAGETYYLVFTNPGNWIRPGSRVSVLLGDTLVQHVAVV